MKQPHSQMTISRLKAAIASYEAGIERHAGKDPANVSRNQSKLKDAVKWLDIRLEEAAAKSLKQNKVENKEFHKRLDVLFGKQYDNEIFQQFTNDLRRHLQNQIV